MLVTNFVPVYPYTCRPLSQGLNCMHLAERRHPKTFMYAKLGWEIECNAKRSEYSTASRSQLDRLQLPRILTKVAR